MSVWESCLKQLEGELSPHLFNAWIRPLQAIERPDSLRLLAPNRYIVEQIVKEKCLHRIQELLQRRNGSVQVKLSIGVGSQARQGDERGSESRPAARVAGATGKARPPQHSSNLRPDYTFDTFVEGKSNQLARAASLQTAKNPGQSYNPLFIYGGTGLGKTHLMHAIGHAIGERKPDINIAYLHSERFVADMVKALQHKAINKFKHYYRSLNVLLIDDIQFLAGKERSQEEFFHTFNILLEGQHQIVMTCDRPPKEVSGLEERLKSRFGSGLTATIEPPELETRIAIIKSGAEQTSVKLPDEAAFFIAERFRSNVRDLKAALNRVTAYSNFTGEKIDIKVCKFALRDLLLSQDKQVTLENIQKTTAEYYKIRVADILSRRKNRSVARPRQVAMALAKELTNHSLPEIGDAFGGRDHTTVLYACRKIDELRKTETKVEEDYNNLVNILTG